MKHFLLLSIFLLPIFAYAQQTPPKNDSLTGKRVFKIDFIAPLTGNLTLGYEQALSRSVSLDFQLGIIGAGAKQSDYPGAFGLFLKAGPCLYINPNYEAPKSKTFSRFQGTYIKPAIIISSFSYDVPTDEYNSSGYYYYSSTVRQTSSYGAFLLNVGHQFVFNRILSFNFYGGVGYYITLSNRDGYSDPEYTYSFYGLGSDLPLALNGGVEIGLVSKR